MKFRTQTVYALRVRERDTSIFLHFRRTAGAAILTALNDQTMNDSHARQKQQCARWQTMQG